MSVEAHSGVRGILISDRTNENIESVYGYYQGDEIIFSEGKYDENRTLMKEHNEEGANNKQTDRIMIRIFILYFLIFVSSIVMTVKDMFSLFELIATSIFLIGTYIPVSSLVLNASGFFANEEANQQFKRFHGAEHKMMNCISKELDVNEENMEKASIYANECGNVYTSTISFYFLIFLAMSMNIMSIGILKTLAVLLILPIVLFFNFLNPYNPFKIFQKTAIAQPTDREIKLAIAAYRRYMEVK